MNSHLERLDGLAPWMIPCVLRLVELCQSKLGRTLMIVSGYRSMEEQWQKYQQGRRFDRGNGVWLVEDESKLLTRARPGLSAHNVVTMKDHKPAAVAVDVIPLDEFGKAEWKIGDDFWDKLYELSWKVGLDPLGDEIGSFLAADRGHLQEPGFTLKMEGLGLTFLGSIITTKI